MYDGIRQHSRFFRFTPHKALGALGLCVCLSASLVAESAPLIATRVWPADVYTRVTFESRTAIKFQYFTLSDPERLAIDLEDIDASPELNALMSRVREDDPYIKQVRVARNKPNVMRIVFDLKGEVKPSIFTLPPVGDYKHRLILDIYPAKAIDPLMALVAPPPPDAIQLAALESQRTQPSAGNKVDVPVAANASSSKPLPSAVTVSPTPTTTQSTETLPKDVAKVTANGEGVRTANSGTPLPPRPALPAQLPTLANSTTSTTTTRPPSALPQRTITIAVDAGHGGEDPGAHGKKGTHEKVVTLAIARLLKAKIDAMPNMRAMLTRDGDYFVPLQERVNKARKVSADLFVSIHADAFTKPNANGSSVFALSETGATSVAARWLAKRENEADLIGGVNIGVKDPYLAKTLLDLSQTATISDSLKVGKAVLSELGEINRLHKGNVEQAGFAVLKAPDIPSILVETAFISNPAEERRLGDVDYQHKLAEAVAEGIKRYFDKNPPLARAGKVALQDR